MVSGLPGDGPAACRRDRSVGAFDIGLSPGWHFRSGPALFAGARSRTAGHTIPSHRRFLFVRHGLQLCSGSEANIF
jgi:hypothetical protein